MDSKVLIDDDGPYFDLSNLFPMGVYAYFTLLNGPSSEIGSLKAFLKRRDHSCKKVHRLKQVHSDRVVGTGSKKAPLRADGLVSDTEGEAVCVVAADCVPILMASDDGLKVAAVHSGWRGTMARIAERGLEAMGCDADRIVAYLGPAIGPCCYEVDRERYTAFVGTFPEIVPERNGPPYRLNLKGLIHQTLKDAGVLEKNIQTERRCSSCSVELCCSYRRDGDGAGRMAAVIGR